MTVSSGPASGLAYQVRREPPGAPGAEALHVLARTWASPPDRKRMAWRYEANPDGPAVTWTVREPAKGMVVGVTAVLPRRVVVEGRVRRAWIGADFSILPEYRTLGIAVQLRRAAREAIDAGEADFLLAFPNEPMKLIHERAGHVRVARLVRMALPLTAAAYLERATGSRTMAAILRPGADLLLRALSPSVSPGPLVISEESPPRFDDRFEVLFHRATAMHRAIGVRDAAYLQWRYDAPGGVHGLLAMNGDRLAGYLLFTVRRGTVDVVDLLEDGESGATRALLGALFQRARGAGLTGLSIVVADRHPALGALRALRFTRRAEGGEVFGYAPQRDGLRSVLGGWYLTVGDRDV